jgi:hypothetical protein
LIPEKIKAGKKAKKEEQNGREKNPDGKNHGP